MSCSRRCDKCMCENTNANIKFYMPKSHKDIAPTLLVRHVSAHANAVLQCEKMVAMWENHPPLVGCFREEMTEIKHCQDRQSARRLYVLHFGSVPVRNRTAQSVTHCSGDQLILSMLPVRNRTAVVM